MPKQKSPDEDHNVCGTSKKAEKKNKRGNRKPRNARISTVKVSLKKRLKDPDILIPIINIAVRQVSRVVRMGSSLLNMTLLNVLEANNGVFPYEVDFSSDSLFFQLFVVNCWDDPLENLHEPHELTKSAVVFRKLYPLLFKSIGRITGDTQLINEAAQRYQTCFINSHVLNIESRMKKYIRTRLNEYEWKKLTNNKNGYAVMNYVLGKTGEVPDDPIVSENIDWIDELRGRFSEYANGISENVSKSILFAKLVQLSYFVGKGIETWDRYWTDKESRQPQKNEYEASEEEDKRRMEEKKNMRYGGSFSIAPICVIKRHFVTLTETIIKEFFAKKIAQAKFPLEKNLGRKWITLANENDGGGEHIWRSLFTEDTFKLRSMNSGWKFGDYMLTDGTSLCVQFIQPGQKPCTKRRKSSKSSCGCYKCSVWKYDDSFQFDRIIAVDPGVCNPVYAVEKDPRGNIAAYAINRKQYHVDSHIRKSTKIMKEHTSRSADVFAGISKCCRKTVSLERQLSYWRYCTSHEEKLFQRLFTKIRSKMALETYIHKTSSMDKFWVSLKNSRNGKVVIAYGSGGAGGTSPTSFAGKRCKQIFGNNVFAVSEEYTSQCCPHCNCRLQDKKEKNFTFPSGRIGTRVFRSVKRCTSPSCVGRALNHPLEPIRKIAETIGAYEMSRDKIGAMNILKCAENIIHGIPRPSHLTFEFNRSIVS